MKPAIQIQQEATLTIDQVQEALEQFDVVGEVTVIYDTASQPPCSAKAQVVPRKRERKPKVSA